MGDIGQRAVRRTGSLAEKAGRRDDEDEELDTGGDVADESLNSANIDQAAPSPSSRIPPRHYRIQRSIIYVDAYPVNKIQVVLSTDLPVIIR